MINTNTNRWQSVRLLFDKHIIGGNLKPNYQWQPSGSIEEEAESFAAGWSCRSPPVVSQFFNACLTEALNVTLKGSDVQLDITSLLRDLDKDGLFKKVVSVVGCCGTDSMCLIIEPRVRC